MINRKKQQGLSFWGWLFVLFSLGCFFAVGIQVGPFYMENETVHNVITDLTEADLKSRNKRKIRESIYKRLDINSVYAFPEEAITINTKDQKVSIGLKYERRVNIVGNAYALVSFDTQFKCYPKCVKSIVKASK